MWRCFNALRRVHQFFCVCFCLHGFIHPRHLRSISTSPLLTRRFRSVRLRGAGLEETGIQSETDQLGAVVELQLLHDA